MTENPFNDHRFNYFERKAFLHEYRKTTSKQKTTAEIKGQDNILYGINDRPPFYLTVLLGIQHYLTMFGGTVSVPLLLAPYLCVQNNPMALSKIINNMFFVSGIATLVQVLVGSRLPIIQGATFAFVQPSIQILSAARFKCLQLSHNVTSSNDSVTGNWTDGIREIQGGIILASLLQTIFGLTGMIGILMKYIGPITQTTTISLIAVSLVKSVADFSSENWMLAIMNLLLILFCSQVMKKRSVLRTFPVLSSLFVSCATTGILRKTGFIKMNEEFSPLIISELDWLQVPYPNRWGNPTFNASSFAAILMGTIISIIESFGNYIACAKAAGIRKPPRHAVNRGIAVEGLTSIFAGFWGSTCGTTSYSENIAAIEVTKVASRQVVIMGAVIMIFLSLFGKFGSLFLLIPRAVIGGMFWALFGSILSVGLSNLQCVNLRSNRNMFVLGFSIFNGLVIPNWVTENPKSIKTGMDCLDHIICTFLSTHMMIGSVTSIILENLLPLDNEGFSFSNTARSLYKRISNTCTENNHINIRNFGDNEQLIGITFRRFYSEDESNLEERLNLSKSDDDRDYKYCSDYDLPKLIQRYLNRKSWVKYVPFLPYRPQVNCSSYIPFSSYRPQVNCSHYL